MVLNPKVGDRVHLLPDLEEELPEEFGTIIDVWESGVTVQLDEKFIDRDAGDDGLRDLSNETWCGNWEIV